MSGTLILIHPFHRSISKFIIHVQTKYTLNHVHHEYTHWLLRPLIMNICIAWDFTISFKTLKYTKTFFIKRKIMQSKFKLWNELSKIKPKQTFIILHPWPFQPLLTDTWSIPSSPLSKAWGILDNTKSTFRQTNKITSWVEKWNYTPTKGKKKLLYIKNGDVKNQAKTRNIDKFFKPKLLSIPFIFCICIVITIIELKPSSFVTVCRGVRRIPWCIIHWRLHPTLWCFICSLLLNILHESTAVEKMFLCWSRWNRL